MNIRTIAVIAVAFAVGGASARAACADEPPRFPLIWQARSKPNDNGATVTRIHDPEAGVNCYVISDTRWNNSNGPTETAAISCVKVH